MNGGTWSRESIASLGAALAVSLGACGGGAQSPFPTPGGSGAGSSGTSTGGGSSGSTGTGGTGAFGGADAGGQSSGSSGTNCQSPPLAKGVTLGAAYQGSYTVYQLPSVPGFSTQEELLAVTLKHGDDDTLLFGCYPSPNATGSFCSVGLTRSCNHITGFAGNGVELGSAPNIDGSMVYAPDGSILFTGWPENTVGILPPGATAPSNTIELDNLQVSSSVGSIQIVPPGLPGAGSLKIAAYDTGDFYDATLVPDATSGYQITNIHKVANLPGGPEGFAYVPHGSPGFPADSIIVSEWDANAVATYQVDLSGNPIVSTRQVFISLTKVEGAYFDLVTGDFIFATWNGDCDRRGNHAVNCKSTGNDYVYLVQGFSKPTPPNVK